MTASGIPLGLSFGPAVAGNWVPGARPLEPFPAFNFAVEIEGLMVGGFSEVSGLGGEVRVQDYREGGVNTHLLTLPSGARQSNITLRHGLTAGSGLWNWFDLTVRGVIQRRSGTIMLLNRMQIPIMWWNFRDGLPVKWTGPDLKADSDDLAFESVEIAHEGLSMPLIGQAAAIGHGLAGMTGAL